MLALVTGGAASGKSEYAENLLCGLCPPPRIYIATMAARDAESLGRIEKHQLARAEKGFYTVEQPLLLGQARLPDARGALLECISNLAANELFMRCGRKQETAGYIVTDILQLYAGLEHLVVVSNEVFADGAIYDEDTARYQQVVAKVNRGIASLADMVIEVVHGIPVSHKGGTG